MLRKCDNLCINLMIKSCINLDKKNKIFSYSIYYVQDLINFITIFEIISGKSSTCIVLTVMLETILFYNI